MKAVLDFLKKIRQWIVDVWNRTEKKERIRFFVIAGIALTLLVGAVIILNSGKYEEFMTDNDTRAVGTVAAALSDNGVTYRITNGNKTIMIDKKDRERAVAIVSQLDLGELTFDYSVVSRGQGIFGSESEKKLYAKYQLEADMRAVLRQYEGVADAAVTLNLPANDRAVYQTEVLPRTASVLLKLKPGYTLTQQQVKGVESYVSGAAGVSPENVTIIDNMLNPLNRNIDEAFASVMSDNFAFTKKVEQSYEESVLKLLAVIVGYDRVSVSVSATLNFDEHQTEKITFVPVVGDEGIPRSIQEMKEVASGRPTAEGEPGVDENGGGDTYAGVDSGLYSDYSRSDVITNYEISEVREQILAARGALEDLTISVVIDSDNLSQENNVPATIQAIVGGAVGLPKSEYGRITVAFQKFDGVAGERAAAEAYEGDLRRAQLYELIRVIVLYAVIGLCVFLLVWRTISIFRPRPEPAPELLPAGGGDYLVGDLDEYNELVSASVRGMEIEVAKSPSRERVEEFIDKNPGAVADMLRNWLSDEANSRW